LIALVVLLDLPEAPPHALTTHATAFANRLLLGHDLFPPDQPLARSFRRIQHADTVIDQP
jgi:hypothetical protein